MGFGRIRQLPEAVDDDRPAFAVPLGRVLVTIDALEALLRIVRADVERESKLDDAQSYAPNEIQIEYSGGTFTEPEQLRKLSDTQLKSLTVTSPTSAVRLTHEATWAFGSREFCNEVKESWASQNTQRSEWSTLMPYLIGLFGLCGIAGSLSARFGLFPQKSLDVTTPEGRIQFLALSISSIVLIGYSSFWILLRSASAKSKVVALTNVEYRTSAANNRWPKAAVYVSIGSVLVAIAAIVVSILIAK